MNIQLESIVTTEFNILFDVVKQGIYPYMEAVFGWDDSYQKRRLLEEYEPNWFYWVKANSIRIGMLCFKPYGNAFHIHFLIIFPEYQNLKFGQTNMAYVHDLAKLEGRNYISLSSFTKNTGAIRFYKKLGYQVAEIEKDFVSLAFKLNSVPVSLNL